MEINDSERKLSSVLTCVYCGMEYPQGTPSHGASVLTEHIKVCPKHPMRNAEFTIKKLRSALVELIGTDSIKELEQMEFEIRVSSAPEADKTSALNAIHALIETGVYQLLQPASHEAKEIEG